MINYQKSVKKIRETLILTQAELAEILGVSFASINRWENGATIPTTAAKRKIVDFCKKNDIKLEDK